MGNNHCLLSNSIKLVVNEEYYKCRGHNKSGDLLKSESSKDNVPPRHKCKHVLFVEHHSLLCSFENGPWFRYVLFAQDHSVLCSFENGPW